MIPPLKLCKEWLLIWQICYRIVSTIAAKSGPLGGIADTFMPMLSAYTFDFLVYNRYIPRRGNNTFFLVT